MNRPRLRETCRYKGCLANLAQKAKEICLPIFVFLSQLERKGVARNVFLYPLKKPTNNERKLMSLEKAHSKR